MGYLKAKLTERERTESARRQRIRRSGADQSTGGKRGTAQNTSQLRQHWNQLQEHFANRNGNSNTEKDLIARGLFEHAKRDYEVARANYQKPMQ